MDRQLSTVQIGLIFATVLCGGFFITLILIAAGDSSSKPTTNLDVTEPLVQDIAQFNGDNALISGYRRQYMNDDSYLPKEIRDMVANFIGLPFILEWRGSALVAVFPYYPLDLGGELEYNFLPDGNKSRSEFLKYSQAKSPSVFLPWESKDQPETVFYHDHVGSDGGNADEWKTVTLAVERYEKGKLTTLAATSVAVPDFRRSLTFILEWRGCALVAVLPYPLFLGANVKYNFWPDENKTFNYYQSGPGVRESTDQPETMFYRHRVGSDGRNADQWKTVNLAVQRAYLDEKDDLQYRELATTSVDVPDFRETLRDTVSSDLKLELRPFPREDVLEPEDQYFRIGFQEIELTRYYFGDSYKVVSTNGEPLGTSTDEKQYFESPNFQGTIEYNRH
eukprot:172073_1